MTIAFESVQTKFQWAFFNGSHRLRSSLVSVRQKSTIVYVFIVLLADHYQ